jgi:small redox-active disulfide protein 2
MAEKEVVRIRVGQFGVGIIGIKELIQEMAQSYNDKSNKEIEAYMLEQLGKNNYIPAGAKEEYGKAFLREFRKFMGQPYEDELSGEVEIKILGPGCPQCDQLEKTVMELLTQLKLPASLEHVRDTNEIVRYGVMFTPALMVNGKIVATGSVPPKEKIKKWVTEAAAGVAAKQG